MSAVERFETTLRSLVWARRRQCVLEMLLTGLSVGLVLSSLALPISALTAPAALGAPHPALLAAAVTGVTAVLAALIGLWRTPGEHQVSLELDRRLGLAERVSTALEFVRESTDELLRERLATRALASRLPARPEKVFAVRFGIWARLLPVAAVLVVAAATVDWPALGHVDTLSDADAEVVAAGNQLNAFAREMRERGRASNLPRATRQAAQLQSLSEQMRSGQLNRTGALERLDSASGDLDRERLAALREGRQVDVGAMSLNSLPLGQDDRRARLRQMLQQLLSGERDAADAAQLGDADLSAAGIDPGQLQDALDDFADGDPDALRAIVEQLPDGQDPGREVRELELAREEVDRVMERLGGTRRPSDDTPQAGGEGAAVPGEAKTEPDGGDWDAEAEDGPTTAGGGLSDGLGGSSEPEPGPESDIQPARGVVLKPPSQLGQGIVRRGEVRALPRINESNQAPLPNVERDYEAQVEAVLERQVIAPHRKAFVRRYFLGVAEAAGGDTPADNSNGNGGAQ